jgi:CBS domain-containing protein
MVDITYWMIPNPPTISESGNIFQAAKLMKDNNVDAVFIVQDNKPIGIFTERDLLRKVVAEKKNVDLTRVSEVMTHPVETLPKNCQYMEVISLMKQKKYRHMPIVDETGKLIGLVTLEGLVKR